MKKKLQKEELEELYRQYFNNSEELDLYKKGIRSKKFRKEFTEDQRNRTMMQYNFLKMALNDNARLLIDHKQADTALLKHAVHNRHLAIKTRWRCLKELSRIPINEWL